MVLSPSIDEFLALEKKLEQDLFLESSISSENIEDFIRHANTALQTTRPAPKKQVGSYSRSASASPKKPSPTSFGKSSPKRPTISSEESLCESCGQEYAAVYCESCKGAICESCDTSIHPPSNPLLSRHFRMKLGEQRRPLSCPNHEDETVSYFCLDCEVEAFCAECVVHPSSAHHGHNVQKLKKSHPFVLKKVEELAEKMRFKLADLSNIFSSIEKVKKEVTKETEQAKSLISSKFDELRAVIAKKEAELLRNADSFLEEHAGLYDYQLKTIQNRMEDLDSSRELVQAKSEDPAELVLLNFYASNKDMLNELMTRDDVDSIVVSAKHKCEFDVESVKNFVGQLQGVVLKINGQEEEINE
ncbi:hypothetical protein RCL1_005825 [Eukaryota sp. TZLM3-RCL]